MPVLPGTPPLTPQTNNLQLPTADPASSASLLASANATAPIDQATGVNLVTGNTGLTSAAVNGLLGFNQDITAAQTDATKAAASATQNSLQADQYGLTAQQDQLVADTYGVDAQGYGLQSQGYGQEINAYNTAAGIAAKNAGLAVASGAVTKAQESRNIEKTLGSQRAEIAGNGFSGGATGAFLYADSMAQGNLELSMTDMATHQQVLGYQQEGAAAQAEAAAAGVAQTGADTAQQDALSAGQRAGLAVQKDQLAQQGAENAAATDTAAANQAMLAGTAAQTNMSNLISSLSGGFGIGAAGGAPGATAASLAAGGLTYTDGYGRTQPWKATKEAVDAVGGQYSMAGMALITGTPQAVTPGFSAAGVIRQDDLTREPTAMLPLSFVKSANMGVS